MASAAVCLVIVAELSKGQLVYLVVLVIVDELPKVLFNLLIDSFHLTVCLWLIGSTEVPFYS